MGAVWRRTLRFGATLAFGAALAGIVPGAPSGAGPDEGTGSGSGAGGIGAGGIGLAVPAAGDAAGRPPSIPEDLRSPSPDARCFLLLPAGRQELEDPARLAPLLEEARGRGLRVVLRLIDDGWSELGSGATPFPAGGWAAALLAFARRHRGDIAAYQVFDRRAARLPAREYAYLLKHASVAIRAAGAGARVVSAPLTPADSDWAEALFALDAAPYLDALAAYDLESVASITALRDRLHPGASIWVTDAAVDPGSPEPSAARIYLESLVAGARVVLFAPPGIPGAALARLRALFPPGLVPAAPRALPFDPGLASPRAEVLAFFDPAGRMGAAAYRALEPGFAIRFPVRAPLEWIDLFDPAAPPGRRIAADVPPGAVIEVPHGGGDFIVLSYRFHASALPVLESTGVGAISDLSAEEIIARERAVRAAQEARLRHYEARVTVAIRYRVASIGQSVDLVTENRLYVHDGKEDYEQTGIYVNGARWHGRTPPHLPFLLPDKVSEVPLDIVLDENYRYTLIGRERVGGRDCFALSFVPVHDDLSLYEGRVFIDTALFTRVRMDAVQTGLKEPLRSNHVIYDFAPVGPPEGELWLPVRVSGQMVFEVLGQNLVVERAATYHDIVPNRDGFADRLAGAYASGQPLFRETREGYYRLDPGGGEETLTSAATTRNALLVMGASIGLGGDPGLPFAGVNFFDFDFKGSGRQLNIAWAGPFVDLSWTHPNVLGAGPGRLPWAVSLQGTFNALERNDRLATDQGIDSSQRLEVLRETVRASLAVPMGHFAKWSIGANATYQNFSRHEDTDPVFVLPTTAIEGSVRLRLEYNRLGYIAAAWGEAGQRSRWRPWGLPGAPFNPDDREFTRFGVELFKSFYQGTFRKLSFGLSGFEGRGLDRFSRFELGDFRSARVRGFNGSGIHFDRGLVADVGYAFTIREGLRVEVDVQEGLIQSRDDFGAGYGRVVGGGLALQFSGPWSTFANIRLSRGLSTTLPLEVGGGDLRIVFFRTFDRWSRRPPPGDVSR